MMRNLSLCLLLLSGTATPVLQAAMWSQQEEENIVAFLYYKCITMIQSNGKAAIMGIHNFLKDAAAKYGEVITSKVRDLLRKIGWPI